MTSTPSPVLGIKPVLDRFRATWLSIVTLAMLANVLMLTPTLYMLNIYDRVFVSQSAWTLLTMSLLALGLLSVMALAEWMRSNRLVHISHDLDQWLSDSIFQANYQGHLANRSDGDARKAFADLTEVRQFITGQGIFAFLDAPWTPIYIGVLFLLHPVLGWTAIGFLALQLVVALLSYQWTRASSAAANTQQQTMHQFVGTHMRDLEAAHAMGQQPATWQRWQALALTAAETHAEHQGRSGAATAVSKWLRYAQQSMVLGVGALLVIRGELSAGAMIASNVLAQRALTPVDQLVQAWRPFLSAKLAYQRLQQLLRPQPTPPGSPLTLDASPECSGWALRDATVCVAGRAAPLLADINLDIDAGRLLVVLGASGSGKTTLARVLVGVCVPDHGQVWLARQPLASRALQPAPTPMGYLPQDIELFEGSVAENIARLGDVDSEAVIQAAQAAGLHDMILRMPKGYDTPIGEGGRALSGGQRQRIALARALYQSPPYIVLDEPNAHLDDQGETALSQTLLMLKARGTTVVLITHRPQVLAIADDVLVLHQGRVHLQGNRTDVLAQLQRMRATASTTQP